MKILELLIERNIYQLNRPFTYLYDKDEPLLVGCRVLITFNNRQLVGYVTSIKELEITKQELEEQLGYNINFIDDVIDHQPILNDDLFALTKKLCDYYLTSEIAILQAMLPPTLSPRKSALKAPKIAYDIYLKVNKIADDNLTAKQFEIYNVIANEGEVLKREIKSASIVKKLTELGYIKEIKKEKRRLQLEHYEEIAIPTLNKEQQNVVDEFVNSDDAIFLLQGVTGSGKTEVYLKLSEMALNKGQSVLMLVPEISLTPMMMEYFIRRFKGDVAILHSELTPAEKYDEYRKIASGECRVVVGARSAIFAPLKNIGLIILDEEHTESYKQDTPPFYHAREVAIMRGKMHNAKVLLGSATPSLDSRARAQKGLYHLLRLDKRVNDQKLPETHIINMLDYHNIDRESYIFSKQLRRQISDRLAKNEQIILLLNRRGFSSNITCRKCGHVFKCPTCNIALTYHKIDGLLKCHHCNYMMAKPDECPECGSSHLMTVGFGSERLEEEIARLFPSARVLRLDSDSAKVRTRISKIITAFKNHEADILIGTQMIAKGHDFPLVTLVGVVLADIGLNLPNYRSSERAFQLITQAVGRAGRKDKKGMAFIQTYAPNHYAITMAARQDYDLFYKSEMRMRQLQIYPPYCYLIAVNFIAKKEDDVISESLLFSQELKERLEDKITVLGPVTPFIPFENNQFHRFILIKYREQKAVRETLKSLLDEHLIKSSVNVQINVDPYSY